MLIAKYSEAQLIAELCFGKAEKAIRVTEQQAKEKQRSIYHSRVSYLNKMRFRNYQLSVQNERSLLTKPASGFKFR